MGAKPRARRQHPAGLADVQVLDLLHWMHSLPTQALPIDDFFDGLARRLLAAGVPIERMISGALAAHPQVAVRAVLWSRELGSEVEILSPEFIAQDRAQGSPFAELSSGRPFFRERLDGDDAALSYGILRELKASGHTDYYATTISRSGFGSHVISFATRARGGFSDTQIRALEQVCPAIGSRMETYSLALTLEGLLEVYLGKDAAGRVLAGGFRRGTGTDIEAAIWFCDLRGFTSLSDTRDARYVVALLDQVFERVGRAVVDQGGTILKFIGDAVLAIFPVGGEGNEATCGRALRAATQALRALDTFNAERARQGEAAIGLGIALHHGHVYYGNIGAADRLDFTVIGRAVNEVCRLEGLCKNLERRLLMTGSFANKLQSSELVSLGAHPFKGVAQRVEVFALDN